MKDKEFGKRLQNMRKIKGLSCEALADMVFVNVVYIRQMEAGEIPGVQLLLTFSRVLDTSPSYLLGFPEGVLREDKILIENIKRMDARQQDLLLYLLDAFLSR